MCDEETDIMSFVITPGYRLGAVAGCKLTVSLHGVVDKCRKTSLIGTWPVLYTHHPVSRCRSLVSRCRCAIRRAY